jgi:hypothetical protein
MNNNEYNQLIEVAIRMHIMIILWDFH